MAIGTNMEVSYNRGTPKSSILVGFSIINHPFRGTTILGNSHMMNQLNQWVLFGGSPQESLVGY